MGLEFALPLLHLDGIRSHLELPFSHLLQVQVELSDRCSAELQSTYLTLSNNEHDGLWKSRTQSLYQDLLPSS